MTVVLNVNGHQPAATTKARPSRLGTPYLEVALIIVCLSLLAVGVWGPSIEQPDHYHAFADQRQFFGIPNFVDVLSNLTFAGFGVLGLWRIWKMKQGTPNSAQQNLAGLFFFGMVVTALFSGWYHLQPNDSGLAIDRYGMTIAFAALLGLAASTRASDRAGQCLTLAVLGFGAWSIWTWSAVGNVLPWAVLQFGGMVMMLGLGCMPARSDALPVSWITVILVYALAKVLEHADEQVYLLTHELVSGHTLKHIVASCAALPVLTAIARASRPQLFPARNAVLAAKRCLLDLPLTSNGAFP